MMFLIIIKGVIMLINFYIWLNVNLFVDLYLSNNSKLKLYNALKERFENEKI